MSYRLSASESLSDAIRRSAGEELSAAARGLAAGGSREEREEAVHEARKAVKKVRSLLRLVAGAVPGKLRRQENALLREAAGQLAGERDAAVLVTTVGNLGSDSVPARSLERLRERLIERRRETALRVVNGPDPATRASAALTDAAHRLATLPVRRDDFEAVISGLDRAYRRGRASLELPLDADGEAWHDWRKYAKDLRYHLEWLSPLWPGPLSAAADELHRLTDLLGDEHDLGVLVATLADEHDRFRELPDLDRVEAAATARRADLRASALDLGARCYAEPAKRFVARMRVYWDVARAGESGGGAAAA